MSTTTPLPTLPSHAEAIVDALEANGYETWCVGGFVRDALIGRPSYDVDLATRAHWSDVERICRQQGFDVFPTGIKHGTVTVVAPEHRDSPLEVTTFRADGRYDDARHPRSVSFVNTIEEDLARRDFTINALAFHPKRGILDPYEGRADLRRRVVRTVRDPERRFAEDALRILRGCRFCAQLGFSLDDGTRRAMLSHKSLLRKVAKERIAREINGLLLGDHVFDALMETVDVLGFVIPELTALKGCPQRTKYHIYDVFEHTAHAVQQTQPDLATRWAALCHDMGKPGAAFIDEHGVEHFYGHPALSEEIAVGMFRRLGLGSRLESEVRTLVRHHDDRIEPTPKSVARILRRFDGDVALFEKLCDLRRADALSRAPQYADGADQAAKMRDALAELLEKNAAFAVRDLAVSGKDALACGISQGPAVGHALESLLQDVVDEKLPNEREALLAALEEIAGNLAHSHA